MLSQMEIFYSRKKIYSGIHDRVLVQVCCDSPTHLQEVLIVDCTVRSERNFRRCDIRKTSAFTYFIALLFS